MVFLVKKIERISGFGSAVGVVKGETQPLKTAMRSTLAPASVVTTM